MMNLSSIGRSAAAARRNAREVSARGMSLLGQPLFGDVAETKVEPPDVIVVGGGSGGLACANRLAERGRQVLLLDYVHPSTQGTVWGFGGTCVNVGCIPKKIFHEAATLRSNLLHDGPALGLAPANAPQGPNVNWSKLVETVQNYVKSLSFSYAAGLHERVRLIRASGTLSTEDNLAVEYVDGFTGETKTETAAQAVVIATGGRPTILDASACPGALEHAITSDDLFSRVEPPGRTLCVGGGYVATEVAGFLGGLGFDVTLAVRSIMLRGDGFDQQCASKIAESLHAEDVKVTTGAVPVRIEKTPSGTLSVNMKDLKSGESETQEYDTVIFGTGRSPNLSALGPAASALHLSEQSKKILVNDSFETSKKGIYALGDAAETGMAELTPVAIKQGELLADQLCGIRQKGEELFKTAALGPNRTATLMVPSTVFTPAEYGRIGFSEEAAYNAFGRDDVEVYLMEWQTLLTSATHRTLGSGEDYPHRCFAKLVCLKSAGERVIGLHYVGPNAGEILQGFALAVTLGVTKSDFDSRALGIHPTDAEALAGGMTVTRASGEEYKRSGGCGGGRCG